MNYNQALLSETQFTNIDLKIVKLAIFIGERIRDIGYSKELNTFILAIEGNGGSIGILKNLTE